MRYAVEYAYGCEDVQTILFDSWWRFAWWILTRSRKCSMLIIYHVRPLPCSFFGSDQGEDPCDGCPEWEECGGYDRGLCEKTRKKEVYL